MNRSQDIHHFAVIKIFYCLSTPLYITNACVRQITSVSVESISCAIHTQNKVGHTYERFSVVSTLMLVISSHTTSCTRLRVEGKNVMRSN